MESTGACHVQKEQHGEEIDKRWKGKSEMGGEKRASKGRGVVGNETLHFLRTPRLSITTK
jgi:hypothetical protein